MHGLTIHFQLLQQLPAGLLIADDVVEDDQVGFMLFNLGQIMDAVGIEDDLVSFRGQDVLKQLQDLLSVIDDHDLYRHIWGPSFSLPPPITDEARLQSRRRWTIGIS